MPRPTVRPALLVAALALVTAACGEGIVSSAGAGGASAPPTALPSPPVTTAVASAPEPAVDPPSYHVPEPPPGYHEAPVRVAGGMDDGNVHLAFIRGEDPDTSPDWAILRVTVQYGEPPFDPQDWIAAYRDLGDEEHPAASRLVASLDVPGRGIGVVERPPDPACQGEIRATTHPGRCGISVLRFSNHPGIQIVITASGTATEAEMLDLAARIEEVSP